MFETVAVIRLGPSVLNVMNRGTLLQSATLPHAMSTPMPSSCNVRSGAVGTMVGVGTGVGVGVVTGVGEGLGDGVGEGVGAGVARALAAALANGVSVGAGVVVEAAIDGGTDGDTSAMVVGEGNANDGRVGAGLGLGSGPDRVRSTNTVAPSRTTSNPASAAVRICAERGVTWGRPTETVRFCTASYWAQARRRGAGGYGPRPAAPAS